MSADATPIDLAKEVDFALGAAQVRPSSREVAVDNRAVTLEPRVMQVLVALAQARGAVVSRDVLIARCWAGVVVGEDAIQRCIGKLRKIGETAGSFEIETLNRIGYRLRICAQSDAGEAAPAPVLGRLAVLPFDYLSADPDMAFLGDSVADEILEAIARRSTIKAIGRTSSFQFRGADKIVARIRQDLGATHVLDGSVRRAGDTLRISAHLMDLADQSMIWSDRFDGGMNDIFALQDEVAAATVAALKGRFDARGRPRAAAPQTLALIARMRDAVGYPIGAAAPAALPELAALARAAGDDPEALGHLALAYATARWSVEPEHERRLREAAASFAAQALDRDAGNGAAHKALFLLSPPIGAFGAVEQRLLQAREAAPQDGEIAWSLYYHYLSVGRTEDSFVAAEEAHRVDPLRPPNALGYANALYTAGRSHEAVALMQRCLERWPNDPLVYAVTLWTAMSEGESALVDRLLQDDHRARFGAEAQRMIEPALFAVETLRKPRGEAIEAAMKRLAAAVAAKRSPFGLFGLCARLGVDLNALYDIVERCDFTALREAAAPATPLNGVIHLFLRINARLRQSPRFVTLCARVGLVAYWRAEGRWPDCAADLAPHYDFRETAEAVWAEGDMCLR